MDRTVLKAYLDEGLSLAEIGRRVDRHEATVAYWVQRHELRAVNAERHAARGAIKRSELERLVSEGHSIAEIAERVDRSKATVRHWLVKYDLRTFSPSGVRRSEESRFAREAGLLRSHMMCARHGDVEFVLDRRGYYRCTRCRSDAVTRRRRKVKLTLVREAGGACRICGYSRCAAALEFHHLVPEDKRFSLSQAGMARSLARARAEAEKCVLLCANCHAEVEAGFAPLTVADEPRIQ
jgi:transposase